MKRLTSEQLRHMYLDFFAKKGHAVIQSASVIPENDPTVLFTTAGMHPLVPYLMGAKHPMGTRLTDAQKCVRTGDIDDVGDASHLTFFEMLGNWSLGDYFKEEAIAWSWEFLTSPDYLGIDPSRLAVSVFAGDDQVPRDEESAAIWRKMGVPEERIFFLPRENNWWGPAGQTGPCGPDTEMFIIRDQEPCGPDCSPACNCGRYLEIWNDVFMQYNKTADGKFEPLAQKNVDTGMGLERTIGVLQGKETVYETDMFAPILRKIEELSGKKYGQSEQVTHAMRIVADHIRTATFILGDERGVTPSNVDQGYVLRRLIRRATRFAMQLEMDEMKLSEVTAAVTEKYKDVYPELAEKKAFILEQIDLEVARFQRTVRQGMHEFEKMMGQMDKLMKGLKDFEPVIAPDGDFENAAQLAKQIGSTLRPLPEFEPLMDVVKKVQAAYEAVKSLQGGLEKIRAQVNRIDGAMAFRLYDTYGFPIEMTLEMAKERGLKVDVDAFNKRFEEHQRRSHAGADHRFKGGLADQTEETARLHTATHLLLASLRRLLGDDIYQKGSNITAERLRFDFNFPRKLTKEELQQVEDMVNDAIRRDLPITCEEMEIEQARKSGAIGTFGDRYGERVRVYTIGDVSKEICGGPHASHTGELGTFKIKKEESSSSGVRRIRAVLE